MSIYVLIEEEGEYSQFRYKILGVFRDLTEARIHRAALLYEQNRLRELAQIIPRFTPNADYYIDQCAPGKLEEAIRLDFPYPEIPAIRENPHYLAEIAHIEMRLAPEFDKARKERTRLDEERAAKDRERHQQEREEVHRFLDWYAGGVRGDPYFFEKLPAQLCSMTKLVQAVAVRDNDVRAIEWLRM